MAMNPSKYTKAQEDAKKYMESQTVPPRAVSGWL